LPVVATRGLTSLIVRAVGAWLISTRDALPCSGCGEPVSLVGRWQCGWCDYVFDGFAFVRCEVCGALPPFLECQSCGVGVKNPMLFGSGRGRR
jgi:hypothetical protein